MGVSAAVGIALAGLHSWKKQFGGQIVLAVEGENQVIRQALFPSYKARDVVEAETVNQVHQAIQDVLEVCKTLKCTVIRMPGFEADDAIAAFCYATTRKTVVMSGDADLWTLTALPHVDVYTNNPASDATAMVNADRIQKKFGKVLKGKDLHPSNITMFKAIYGDASDAIPRVPRIKFEQLTCFDTINGLHPDLFFAWLDQQDIALRNKIDPYRDQIRTMYDVVRLRVEHPVDSQSYTGDIGLLTHYCDFYGCSEFVRSGKAQLLL